MELPTQDCARPWCLVFLNLVRPSDWIAGSCEPIRTVPSSPEVFLLNMSAEERATKSGAELKVLLR